MAQVTKNCRLDKDCKGINDDDKKRIFVELKLTFYDP
jgi:hypothetical protein